MYNKQRWLISYFSFRKEKWTSAKSIRDILCFTQRKPPKHTCTVLYWGKVNDQFSVDPQEKDFSVSLTSSERSRGRGAPSVGIPILLFHRFSSSVAVIQTQTVAYLRTPSKQNVWDTELPNTQSAFTAARRMERPLQLFAASAAAWSPAHFRGTGEPWILSVLALWFNRAELQIEA